MTRGGPFAVRFADSYEVTSAGCWMWSKKVHSTGYAYTRVDGKMVRAHRAAYELLVGPIPEGLVLDHLCRNRSCVNPAHLEPVTQRENLLRGNTTTARNAAATTCRLGHPLDGRYPTRGVRYCKTCRRAEAKASRLRARFGGVA